MMLDRCWLCSRRLAYEPVAWLLAPGSWLLACLLAPGLSMNTDRLDALAVRMANAYAAQSKDPSTKVGCVIVAPNGAIRSGGYNGCVRGVLDTVERISTRPGKYLWMEHAERNAIYNAACDLSGCDLYVTGLPPCARCARGIIQVGIKSGWFPGGLIVPERWEEDMLVSMEMLSEAGVTVRSGGLGC